MFSDPGSGDHGLFTAMFSDELVADVEVAIVVAHPGDETVCASWLMVRLQERASVFCLAKASHGCPGGFLQHGTLERAASSAAMTAAAALAGVPNDRCHNLGLSETDQASHAAMSRRSLCLHGWRRASE